MPSMPTWVAFDYPDSCQHFSELVWATEAQIAQLRALLSRAAAAGRIGPDWYVGPPQQEPSEFAEFLARLSAALGDDLGAEA